MSVITLTSDYGIVDHDVAALKGDIWRNMPNAQIVDISHDVAPYNIMQAAYLVGRTFHHYPEGTIHFILVDGLPDKNKPHLLWEMLGQFFIGPDNGVLSLIAPNEKPTRVIQIDLRNMKVEGDPYDIYTQVAAHLSRGGKASVLGQTAKDFEQKSASRPTLIPDRNEVIAHVIHIDTFGNLVTNLTKKWLVENTGTKKLTVIARNKRITRIVDAYNDGPTEGELFCVFNSDGYLEIAVQKPGGRMINSACSLLGLQINSNIYIELQ